MPILTEQRERRDVQPVPTDADGASVKFVCGVYRCTMSGQTCRDYHVHAVEFRPENREACIDCPAGIARAKLLGMRDATFIRPEMCQGKTAKGAQCTNVAATDGLCHGCKGNAASRSMGSANARSAAWNGKRKAKSPAKSAASPKKRPWMVKSGAHGITQAAAVQACARAGCDRPTVPGTALSEYCRECVNTAYTSLRKSSGRTPTNAERAEWLASHPAMVKYRRRGAEDVDPGVVVVPADVPVPDVCVAVSPSVVDEVVEVVTEAETVAAVDVPEWPPLVFDDNDPLCYCCQSAYAILSVGEYWCPQCGKFPDQVDGVCHHAPLQDVTADVTPDDPRLPDHQVVITIPLNRRAYAELERMAAAGLHGDDPCDAARTLILDGLRRRVLVRL